MGQVFSAIFLFSGFFFFRIIFHMYHCPSLGVPPSRSCFSCGTPASAAPASSNRFSENADHARNGRAMPIPSPSASVAHLARTAARNSAGRPPILRAVSRKIRKPYSRRRARKWAAVLLGKRFVVVAIFSRFSVETRLLKVVAVYVYYCVRTVRSNICRLGGGWFG